jgi:hypothetical protein
MRQVRDGQSLHFLRRNRRRLASWIQISQIVFGAPILVAFLLPEFQARLFFLSCSLDILLHCTVRRRESWKIKRTLSCH